METAGGPAFRVLCEGRGCSAVTAETLAILLLLYCLGSEAVSTNPTLASPGPGEKVGTELHPPCHSEPCEESALRRRKCTVPQAEAAPSLIPDPQSLNSSHPAL